MLYWAEKYFHFGEMSGMYWLELYFFLFCLRSLHRTAVFPWGGAVGDLISEWLTRFLGIIGTAALLLVAGLAYFIWRFNPVFNVPKFKKNITLIKARADESTAASEPDKTTALLEKGNNN